MNHADSASLSMSGAGTLTFANPTPNYTFSSGSPNELTISPTGVKFRGETVADAGQLYHALMAALGQGAESVTFFRNRGAGGIWVEADAEVLAIIRGDGMNPNYEVRRMYSHPRAPVPNARLEEIAREYDLKIDGPMYAFAVAVRAEP